MNKKLKKNVVTGLALIGVAVGMFAFAFANIPVFRLYCQKVGIALSPNAKAKPSSDLPNSRKVRVLFTGVVAGDAPIVFSAQEAFLTIPLGKENETAYRFVNLSSDTIRFRPVHSILPEAAARRFSLKKCFCFDDQTLLPRQEVLLPVVFSINADLDAEVEQVTLNYTLFQKPLHGEN